MVNRPKGHFRLLSVVLADSPNLSHAAFTSSFRCFAFRFATIERFSFSLKLGLHVRRKHKHKHKHKHKDVYTCDKHKRNVTYARAEAAEI